MGIPLDAPLTQHSVVYTLPMLTIKEDKGETGDPFKKERKGKERIFICVNQLHFRFNSDFETGENNESEKACS